MKDEEINIGWKDVLAITIAFLQLALPYAILLISSIALLMFLFSLI